MIRLLSTLILAEATLVLSLLFGSPLRKVVLMGLDKVKQGKGAVMVHTVEGTLFVVLISILYNLREVQKRLSEVGSVNPTDQVLMANHLLEASLMGSSLFLALLIRKLHDYIKELLQLRTSMEAVNKPVINKKNQDYDQAGKIEPANKKTEFESKTKDKTVALKGTKAEGSG